ncbi:MAG: TolB family protein [Acidobacteria bacterium]|nr:TolB family protein [Acidobacteriota bacterium]
MKLLAFFGVLTLAFAQQPQPAFDIHGDLGATPRTGSFAYDPATREYRITGGGANIWGTEDAGYFAWRRLSGDVTITADVRFEGTGAVAHRKAVLMVRQDLTPGSAYADVALHGDGLTSLQYRPTAGAQTAEVRSTMTAPTRIRIERRGNTFTIYAGKDGAELTAAGPQTVALTGTVYVGLGVCSHDANVLETAVFSNVTVQTPAPRYRSKITVYDLTTRTNRTIYTADQVIEAPNWSRDGKYLLVNTNGSLYRLPLGAADPKLEKLEMGDGGWRCNNDHDFTLDGKLLAFSASTPNSRQSQVWLAGGDGSHPKLMTPLSPSYFHGWSPDAKWLAFVGQRDGKFTLFRVPVEGGAEERLTSAGYDDGPEYSPDGKFIYFNSNRNGGWDIWRIPADGGGTNDAKAERVTSDEVEDWFPHFSPDGKRMLIFGFPKGTANHNDKMDGVVLRIMPAPGRKLKPAKPEVLVKFFGGQGTINVNSWSPDSKKFAYVVYEKL